MMAEWRHVYPINDLIEHTTNTSGTDEFICQCGPEVDVENNLVIHSSLDRREVFENENM